MGNADLRGRGSAVKQGGITVGTLCDHPFTLHPLPPTFLALSVVKCRFVETSRPEHKRALKGNGTACEM